MKYIALFVSLALFTLAGCASNQPKHIEVYERPALELLEVTDMEKISKQLEEQVVGQLKQLVAQQFGDTQLPQEAQEITEKYMDKNMALIFDAVSWSKMKDKYAEIYEDVFTSEELHHLIAFYKSDLGKLTLEKMPALMQQSMKVSQFEIQKIMPQVKNNMSEMRKELGTLQNKTAE